MGLFAYYQFLLIKIITYINVFINIYNVNAICYINEDR